MHRFNNQPCVCVSNPSGPNSRKTPQHTKREVPLKSLTLKCFFACFLPDLQLLEDRIPSAPLALDDALDVARNPTAIEVARLGLSALAIDIALPRRGIEGEVALDGLVALRGLVVGPDSVGNGLGGGNGAHDGVVCGSSLPLAKGRPGSSREGEAHERGGNVVSCRWGVVGVSGRLHTRIYCKVAG